jgi:hypothetical protein
VNIVSCKVVPFAVRFVEIYVPRNCADAAYVQSALTKSTKNDVLASSLAHKLIETNVNAYAVTIVNV